MVGIYLALMLQSIELGKLKTTAYTDERNGIQKSEFQVGKSVRSTKPYFPDIITDGVPECAGAQSEQLPFFMISFYFMQCLCCEICRDNKSAVAIYISVQLITAW